MATNFNMTEDDTVRPDTSLAEDILELSLLTPAQNIGPVDMPRQDRRPDGR